MDSLIPLYLYQGHTLPPPSHLYDYVLAAQGLLKRSDNSPLDPNAVYRFINRWLVVEEGAVR